MDKRELKKQILAQLASYLQREVIIDGLHGADMAKCDEVQAELAAEFKRRSKTATNQSSGLRREANFAPQDRAEKHNA